MTTATKKGKKVTKEKVIAKTLPIKESKPFHEIYTPIKDHIVIEYYLKGITTGGVIIPEGSQERDVVMKVAAVSESLKGEYKVGDWIIIAPDTVVIEVPLEYGDANVCKYGQVKGYQLMGTVDAKWLKASKHNTPNLEA